MRGEIYGTAIDALFGVHEGRTIYEAPAAPVSERHVQAVWYDRALRPAVLRTADGADVRVIDPGTWNLEAGPDFRNAVIEVGRSRLRLVGDVEVHLRPADWDAHHHATDSAYAHVVLHATWYPGPPPESLPSGAVSVALGPALRARPDFSPDAIDLAAYPFARLPSTPRPCEAILAHDPDLARVVLRAAGSYRLGIKARRIVARLVKTRDRAQVFYEEVLAALGYKQNAAPFRAVAAALPLAELPADREAAFARLLGVAGLLPMIEDAADDASRVFVRSLWDSWFLHSREHIPRETVWRFANVRPPNSPVRRLAAAAALFGGTALLAELDALDLAAKSGQAAAIAALLARCRWPYWESHPSFASRPSGRKTDLLGARRAAAIVANVVVPFALAEKRLAAAPAVLPPEDVSAPVRLAAFRLFGRDHNPALYSGNGLLIQGLIQIHRDFCLAAHPDCGDCALLRALSTS